jgi:hypothetical protein
MLGSSDLCIQARPAMVSAQRSRADFLVGQIQLFGNARRAGQHRNHLAANGKLHLIHQGALRWIFHGHDQPVVAQQQRQHVKPLCNFERHFLEGKHVDRKALDVDHGIAHLAGQSDVQIFPRDPASANQQLTQRDRAVLFLILQRMAQLVLRDQAQGGERFTDLDHGHFGLLIERLHQLLG